MRNGCARPELGKTPLQKALWPKPADWVCHRRRLPPENPSGHRKAYRRV